MRRWLLWLLTLVAVLTSVRAAGPAADEGAGRPDLGHHRKVCIIPVREEIMPPLLYLIRRGVKSAIEQQASLIILDMNTPGGRIDTTKEIFDILDQFKGETVTYVNKDAYSAGSFIAAATSKIYMSPGSVIGAAAPIMVSPEGGVSAMPDTVERKMTSAVLAMVRTVAVKNGHNAAVLEAMVDKTKGLTIDGEVIVQKGDLLTLTNVEAEKEYGNPPHKLLSAGTVDSLDKLLSQLGYADAVRISIEPTGFERLGAWLNALSPILLIIGMLGIYIEFKTPGTIVPGVIGVAAFALYFFGGYVAGLSGLEWIAVFALGVILILVELFFFPGTILIGVFGILLILISVVMALVDLYPNPGPGINLPSLPSFNAFRLPLQQLTMSFGGGALAIWLLSLVLPKTQWYRSVVSTSASGVRTEAAQDQRRAARIGQTGVAISTLRPGGKAQFGDDILDVMSQGELVPKGTTVRIVAYSGTEAVVETVAAS